MEKQEKSRKKRTTKKVIKVAPQEPTVTFKYFFNRQVALGKLNPLQERELEAWCRDNKLKSKETEATFQEVISKY